MAGEKILILEDENTGALDIERGLKRLGYQVAGSAGRSEDAVAKAEADRPDLVLVDIRLKNGTSGIEAADAIRRKFSIPVIFLIAYADEPNSPRVKLAEPCGYPLKPFDETELHTVIEEALRKHSMAGASHAHTKEALRKAEDQLKLFIESVSDYAIFLLDASGHVITWNSGAGAIKGYSPNEVLGKHFSLFYTRDEIAAGVPDEVMRAATLHGRHHYEGFRVRKDGSQFWAEVTLNALRDQTGAICGFGKVTRDMTERREIQERLRASEAHFRSLFEQAAVGVAHVTLEGRFALVNQRCADILGHSRDALQTLTYQDLSYPGGMATELDQTRALLAGEIPFYSIEKRYLHRNGGAVWVNLSVSLVREESGAPGHFVAVLEDITQRIEAESEILRLNARLEAANRELEAFSYSVSHDLRAPLRGLHGFLGILEEDHASKLDAEGLRVVQVVRSEAKRMGRLIDDLLSFSRLGREGMSFTSVDMSALARTEFELHSRSWEGNPMDFRLQPVPNAWGDASMLRQVFANLLGNAFKFTRPTAHPVIEVGGWSTDEETTWYVKDNGVGFDDQYSHKLFRVFQRLHSEADFEGTGIGLSLVQRIVERHNGRVWAQSKLHEGATFFFSLPSRKAAP